MEMLRNCQNEMNPLIEHNTFVRRDVSHPETEAHIIQRPFGFGQSGKSGKREMRPLAHNIV